MKQICRTLSIIFSIIFVFQSSFVLFANDNKIGNNCYYNFDNTSKTLNIYGDGSTFNYNISPFSAYKNDVDKIVVSYGVTVLGDSLFKNLPNVKEINLPDSVTRISDFTFFGCQSLNEIEIPSSVCYISNTSFNNCISLSNIFVDNHNNQFTSVDGVLYSSNGSCLVKYPSNKIDKEYLVNKNCTNICTNSFENCKNLEFLEIPDSVESIEDNAFVNSNITRIRIYNRKCEIGVNTFTNVVVEGYMSSSADTFAAQNALSFSPLDLVSHIHNYSYIFVKESCDSSGYSVYKCNCGEEYNYNIIPAKGHLYINDYKKASLNSNGYFKSICQICGLENSSDYIKFSKIDRIEIINSSANYNGNKHLLNVKIYDKNGNVLKQNIDYTISSASSVNVGKYKAKLNFIGNYEGYKDLSYKIVPSKTNVTKYTSNKNSISINFKKINKQITGYRIAVGTKNKKGNIKYCYKNFSTNGSKYTIKKLKSKNTYYVKIQTYKIVGKEYFYSGYSKVYKIKTK